MAKKNSVSGKKKDAPIVSNFIKRLSTKPDLRLGEVLPISNRISLLFRLLAKNLSTLIIVNFLFLLFAAPTLVMFMYYLPKQIAMGTANYNFIGSFGIGYPGVFDAYFKGMEYIYDQRILMSLYLIPCLAFMGIGFSGLFYVARNLVWGVPVKPLQQFFRGVKKYALKFIPISVLLSLLICLTMFSFTMQKKLALEGQQNSGYVALSVFAIMFLLLTIIFEVIAAPMTVAYDFKFKEIVKNSIILSLALILPIVVSVLFLSLPLLLFLGTIGKTVGVLIFISVGFVFYALSITLLGNYAFENLLNPLHRLREKKNINVARVNNAKKKENKQSSNNTKQKVQEAKVIDVEAECVKDDASQDDIEIQKRKERYMRAYNNRQKQKRK